MTPTTTLGEARIFVEQGKTRPKGVKCPCCDRQITIRCRRITRSMALALVLLDRNLDGNPPNSWIHVPEYLTTHVPNRWTVPRGGDYGKLVHWGLLERPTRGGPRSGFFRVTQRGADFARGRCRVRKLVWLDRNVVVLRDGDLVGIRDVFGDRDDAYDNLMVSLPDRG